MQDLVGKRFSLRLVTGFAGKSKWGELLYKCVCDCGKECTTSKRQLKKTESCGCRRGKSHPNNTDVQRECSDCKKILPLTKEFFYKGNGGYGFSNQCIPCNKMSSPKYYQGPEGRVKRLMCGYRFVDKERGITNDLTRDFVFNLVQLPCHYCGDVIMDRGLDAKESSKGHMQNNVVPCCAFCNTAKWDHFTSEETELYIGPAIAAIKKERGQRCR